MNAIDAANVDGTNSSLKKAVSESVTVPGRLPLTPPTLSPDSRVASEVKEVMERTLSMQTVSVDEVERKRTRGARRKHLGPYRDRECVGRCDSTDE